MMCTYYFEYKNNILLSVKPPLYTFHYQSPQKNTMPAFSNHVTKKCTESFNGLFNNAGSVSLVYNNNIWLNLIKIKNTKNDSYLSDAEVRKIFPPDNITAQFIDIVRLRPALSKTPPGLATKGNT